MSNFTVIETQEQFDEAIKERIARLTAKHNEELSELSAKLANYDDFKSKAEKTDELTARVAELEKAVTEKDAKIAAQATAALKAGIAREFNLPYEMAERLTGTEEADIRKDAESLSKLMGNRTPMFNPEPKEPGEGAELKELLKNLNL